MGIGLHGTGLSYDLLERHEGFSGGHASCAAPESGVLVQPEQALLQALVFESSQSSDSCICI